MQQCSGDGAVGHRGSHSNPFIEVLSLRKHDSRAQVARTQRRGCMLHQVILVGALRDVLLGFEGLACPAPTAEMGEFCTSQPQRQQSYLSQFSFMLSLTTKVYNAKI
ncbi:hypothetical protein E2C01_010712 [Portunus trituberculatus]|uniref:Uncharacterized protein n=1 Tax=Portunus trituberculatus TaxID=210409 RepID=A0A5B7D9K9_PORTR|nr:hypothetical protein [Portunus trituberculatus]